MKIQGASLKKIISFQKKEIKIFIIEDDPMYRSFLQHKFKKFAQYSVHFFKTGEDCFKQLDIVKPDIIVLDYSLNHSAPYAMNGLEVLQLLKKMNSEILVIMLSGQENFVIASNCVKYGAFDYIIKGESDFVRLQHLIGRAKEKLKLQKVNAIFAKIILGIALLTILPVLSYCFMPNFTMLIAFTVAVGLFSLFIIIKNRKLSKGALMFNLIGNKTLIAK